MKHHPLPSSYMALLWSAVLSITAPASADEPGRGRTAELEIEFMKTTIDHHYSALRITELAAGTDLRRDAALSPTEGTAPSPGFAATPAKATLDDLKSLARRNNRMQREEILTLQAFLRDWYKIDHQPTLRPEGWAMIRRLEAARPGADFNQHFYKIFTRHHYEMLGHANACLAGADMRHEELRMECRNMWHGQVSDIDTMRRELERHFGIVDFVPFRGHEPLHHEEHGDANGSEHR